MHPTQKNILGLLGWFLGTFAVSAVGARASITASRFYGELAQPAWSPPAWVFGPVWTTLYALMAIAAWLVWRQGGFRAQRLPLILFLVQLGLNALWSWLFFAWQLGGPAFVEVLLLWIVIAATIVTFYRVSRVAAAMLVPYLAWVSFASALNFALWRMNPGILGM